VGAEPGSTAELLSRDRRGTGAERRGDHRRAQRARRRLRGHRRLRRTGLRCADPPALDIDFTPSSRPENLRRITDALGELGARLRVVNIPDGVPFDPEPQLIVQMAMLNLTCRYGDFDLAFHPSGTGGFEDLTVRATAVLIGDTQARVAALADVIRSKRAAARPKDLRVLPTLEQYARSQGIELRDATE